MRAERGQRWSAWCALGGTEVDAEWSQAEFEEHVRHEHSTFRSILEPMILTAGFTIVDAAYSPDTFDARYLLHRTAT